jgi:hypothetical protein
MSARPAPGARFAPLTDEDFAIVLELAYRHQGAGRGVHAYYHNAWAQDFEAALMARLARTRRNNRRARAFAEGEL